MSIQTQIDRIKKDVEDVYTALELKGLLPPTADGKLDSLPGIVSEIEAGIIYEQDQSVIDLVQRSASTINNTSLNALGPYIAYKSDFTELRFAGVVSAGDYCFRESTSLTTVEMPSLTTAGSYLFYGCTALQNVKFNSLETAGQYMFYQTNINSIDEDKFPVLKVLGPYSFATDQSKISSIDHTKVITIGNYALQNNRYITYWNLPNLTTIDDYGMQGVYHTNSSLGLTQYPLPSLVSIGNYGMASMTQVRTVSYPNLLRIGNYAFQSNTSLQTVDLPALTTMNAYAFTDCTAISSFNLPLLTDIYDHAFNNCSNLYRISMPSLTNIRGGYLFTGASHLRYLAVPELVDATLTSYSFSGSQFMEIDAPKLASLGTYTFNDCANLYQFKTDALSNIQNRAFSGSQALQKIWIPKEATVAGTSTSASYLPFYRCHHLKIFTDAEERPSTWGQYFNLVYNSNNDSYRLPVQYNATVEDYNAHKVLNANPYCNTTNHANAVRINDGVVSNFTRYGCVRVRNWDFNRRANIELVIKFTMPDTAPSGTQYLFYNNQWLRLCTGALSDNRVTLTRYRFTDNTQFSIAELELGQTYWIKCKINGGKEQYFISQDGETFVFMNENKDYSNYMDNGTFNDYMYFGNCGNDNNGTQWTGTIDFNGCWITYNGEPLWTGIVGATIPTTIDVGYEPPQPEVLDTDRLIAHWDFENNFIDDIGGLAIDSAWRGNIMSDEQYRGSYSVIAPSTSAYDYNYGSDITSLNLTWDQDWCLTFRQHSDYFNQTITNNTYYYSTTVGFYTYDSSGRAVDSTALWNIYNGGKNNTLSFNGKCPAILDIADVKQYLHEGWNEFCCQYDHVNKRMSLFINGNCVGAMERVYPGWDDSSYNLDKINRLYMYAYSRSYRQYIDDICIYRKLKYVVPSSWIPVVDREGLIAYWDFCKNKETGKTVYQDEIRRLTVPNGSYSGSSTSWGNGTYGGYETYTYTPTLNISSLQLDNHQSFSIEWDMDALGDYWYDEGISRPSDTTNLHSAIWFTNSSGNVIFGARGKGLCAGGVGIYGITADENYVVPVQTKPMWNKLTLTYNCVTKDIKLYCNDVLELTQNYPNEFTIQNMVFSSGHDDNSWSNGIMDNIKIYNRVLHDTTDYTQYQQVEVSDTYSGFSAAANTRRYIEFPHDNYDITKGLEYVIAFSTGSSTSTTQRLLWNPNQLCVGITNTSGWLSTYNYTTSAWNNLFEIKANTKYWLKIVQSAVVDNNVTREFYISLDGINYNFLTSHINNTNTSGNKKTALPLFGCGDADTSYQWQGSIDLFNSYMKVGSTTVFDGHNYTEGVDLYTRGKLGKTSSNMYYGFASGNYVDIINNSFLSTNNQVWNIHFRTGNNVSNWTQRILHHEYAIAIELNNGNIVAYNWNASSYFTIKEGATRNTNYWIRLVRNGANITTFWSTDGETFNEGGTATETETFNANYINYPTRLGWWSGETTEGGAFDGMFYFNDLVVTTDGETVFDGSQAVLNTDYREIASQGYARKLIYDWVPLGYEKVYVDSYYTGFGNNAYLRIPSGWSTYKGVKMLTKVRFTSLSTYNCLLSNTWTERIVGTNQQTSTVGGWDGSWRAGTYTLQTGKWYWYMYKDGTDSELDPTKVYILEDNNYTESTLPDLSEWTDAAVPFGINMFNNTGYDLIFGNDYQSSSINSSIQMKNLHIWNGEDEVFNLETAVPSVDYTPVGTACKVDVYEWQPAGEPGPTPVPENPKLLVENFE